MRNDQLNILIVEDDGLTMATTKRLLRPYGKILSASTEAHAHELIQTKNIDIAFFDLNLNGELSGLKLVSYALIHDIYPIVLSGENKTNILEEAFKNGGQRLFK